MTGSLMSAVDLDDRLISAVERCCSPAALPVYFVLAYLGGIAMLGSGIHLFIAYKHEADYVDRKNMDFTPLNTTCLITGVTHTYKTIREDRCKFDCGGRYTDKRDLYELCQDTRSFTFTWSGDGDDKVHTSGPMVTKRSLSRAMGTTYSWSGDGDQNTMCYGPNVGWHGKWCTGRRECDGGGSRDSKSCQWLIDGSLQNLTDDGKCDDGGDGAEYSYCGYGTDEADCGVRDCTAAADAAAATDAATSRRLAALTGPAGEHGGAPTDAEPLPAGDEDGAHAGAGEHGPRGRRLARAEVDEQPSPTGANLDPRRTTLCPALAPGQLGDRVPCWRPAEPCGRPGATSGTWDWEAGPCPASFPIRYNCGDRDCYKIVDPRLEETAHDNIFQFETARGMFGGVILMGFGGFITAVPFIMCLGVTIMLLAQCCQWGCKCNVAQAARSRESARRLSNNVQMLGGANAAPMRWLSSTTSDRIDVVRARLADRGVNSSTHGTVVNDAAIEEELKAQGGHVGRTVNRLMNRTERSEEAQAAAITLE